MKNIFNYKVRFKFMAERVLKQTLPADIAHLAYIFHSQGFQLYLVGGCIRDTFLKKQPKDYDVVTNAMPDTVISILSQHGIEYQTQGEHFGVVVAKFSAGRDIYEIATFRKDLNDTEDRNTNVQLGVSIEDDVQRRDFTINALFYDIHQGKIIDLVGGIYDLNQGVVRCVGTPKQRFAEDNLRKLRAVRFATRLGFTLHDQTFDAIVADNRLLVTRERIYNELLTMYQSAINHYDLITLLYRTRLVYGIFNPIKVQSYGDIPVPHKYSWNLFLATILFNYEGNYTGIDTQLLDYKFPLTVAKSIKFLIQCRNLTDITPLQFYKARQTTDLTDAEILSFCFPSKQLTWLVNFKPSSDITKKLQNAGFEGKQLGEQIAKHYLLKYKVETK